MDAITYLLCELIMPIKNVYHMLWIDFVGQSDEKKKWIVLTSHKKWTRKLGVDRFHWMASCSTQFIITFSSYHHMKSLSVREKLSPKYVKGLLVDLQFIRTKSNSQTIFFSLDNCLLWYIRIVRPIGIVVKFIYNRKYV